MQPTYPLWLQYVICESWFAISWILYQFPKWITVVSHETYLDRLSIRNKSASNSITGSKTLFVGNPSYSVGEHEILNFFKDAGEVVELRLASRYGRFAGYARVEFATHDAAQKALELNNELLLDRAVRLDLAKEKGAYTPGNDTSSQKSGQSQVQTIFVRGFGTDDGFDDVKSSLKEHFRKHGEISRMAIPKDFESGALKVGCFHRFY